MHINDLPTAVYRLYDADDRLLYVGISNKPETRWKTHAATKWWWPQVARKTTQWLPNRGAATDSERAAVKAERPRFNVVNHPVNWPAALEIGKHRAQATYRRKRGAKRLLGIAGTPTLDQRRAIDKVARLTRPLLWSDTQPDASAA